jgi:hypothetical protein
LQWIYTALLKSFHSHSWSDALPLVEPSLIHLSKSLVYEAPFTFPSRAPLERTQKSEVLSHFAAEAWNHMSAQKFCVVFAEYENIGIALYYRMLFLWLWFVYFRPSIYRAWMRVRKIKYRLWWRSQHRTTTQCSKW